MNNRQMWKRKISIAGALFFVILIFNINRNSAYESEMTILLLPKNESMAKEIDSVRGNFKQIMQSLVFCDEVSKQNESLSVTQDLSNYQRKKFCDSKSEVSLVEKSTMIKVKNFDKDGVLARELNSDMVGVLIASAGKYYNINTALELRIVDGPIVKLDSFRNSLWLFGESIFWTIVIYAGLFFLVPFIFIKKKKTNFPVLKNNFSSKTPFEKMVSIFPETENYFADKNFFPAKTTILSVGKKAPTPVNLPVNEEAVPDIFREKIVVAEDGATEKKENANENYVHREATPDEVKERLNKLLRGGK
jgi:hypothetical protein